MGLLGIFFLTYHLLELFLDGLTVFSFLSCIVVATVDALSVGELQLKQSPTEPLDSLGKTWQMGSFKNRGFSLRNFAHVPLVLLFAVPVALLFASVDFFITLSDLLSVFVAFCEVFPSLSLLLPPISLVSSGFTETADSLKRSDFMGFSRVWLQLASASSLLTDGVGDSEELLVFSTLILHTVQSWPEYSILFSESLIAAQILTTM